MNRPVHDDSILLSIIIPTYNVEEYIEECLQSVLDQDVNSYEIICVDDNSDDKTVEIISQYAQKYPNIKVFSNGKKGIGGCRNYGVSEAHGRYIQFLDSDDVFMPNTLGMLTRHMEEAQLDVVYFSFENFLHDKSAEADKLLRINERYHKGNYNSDGTLSGVELLNEFYSNDDNNISCWNCMIRKNYLTDHSIAFNPSIYYEDWPFAMQLLLEANKVRCINDVCIRRRIRRNSITQGSVDAFHIYSMIVAVKEMYQIAEKNMSIWEDSYEQMAYAMYIRTYILSREFRKADEKKRTEVLSMCSAEDVMYMKSLIEPWSNVRNREIEAKRECRILKRECRNLEKETDNCKKQIVNLQKQKTELNNELSRTKEKNKELQARLDKINNEFHRRAARRIARTVRRLKSE